MRVGAYLIESAGGVEPRSAAIASPTHLTACARHAEEVGLDSLWIPDHVAIPARYVSRYPYQDDGGDWQPYPWEATPFVEPLIGLAWAGAVTTTLELGTGVLIAPQREPLLLAKQAATIDALTGGRLKLGLGIGWLREELEALGAPWPGRARRTEEMIEAMRTVWTQDTAGYDGEHVSFAPVRSLPHPTRPTGVPIVLGGHSEPAARRAGRLADGFMPLVRSGDSFDTARLIAVMRDAALDAGRDPDAIEIVGFGAEDPAALHAMREAGFDHVFFFVTEPSDDAARARIERIAALAHQVRA
jgi:probable F420-dependent oxidoreductase